MAADHHVRGLQVPVDHALGMGVADGVADLAEDRQQAGEVGRAGGVSPLSLWIVRRSGPLMGLTPHARLLVLLQQLPQGAPADQLHGKERAAVGGHALFDHRRDAGVLEAAGQQGLAGQSRGVLGGAAVFSQQLHRQVAAEVRVLDPPHLTDPAHARPLHGAVPRGQRGDGGSCGAGGGHRGGGSRAVGGGRRPVERRAASGGAGTVPGPARSRVGPAAATLPGRRRSPSQPRPRCPTPNPQSPRVRSPRA